MWHKDGRIAEAKYSLRDARAMGAIATPQHQAQRLRNARCEQQITHRSSREQQGDLQKEVYRSSHFVGLRHRQGDSGT